MSGFVKVLQLNCLHIEQAKRYSVISEAIASANPDIGMLQEVHDHKVMTKLLAKAGYDHVLAKESIAINGDGESVMLFSKTPWHSPEVPLVSLPKKLGRTLAGVTIFAGVRILAISSHSPWGGNTEGVRLRHNEVIDSLAEAVAYASDTSLTILGADLNAEPDYRSVRYLLGRDLASDNDSGALWTDGWTSVGDSEHEITISAKNNALAANMASLTGAKATAAVPDRRIDYLMTRGWNYGRRGGFLSFDLLNSPTGLDISDHYGLVAKIQL